MCSVFFRGGKGSLHPLVYSWTRRISIQLYRFLKNSVTSGTPIYKNIGEDKD